MRKPCNQARTGQTVLRQISEELQIDPEKSTLADKALRMLSAGQPAFITTYSEMAEAMMLIAEGEGDRRKAAEIGVWLMSKKLNDAGRPGVRESAQGWAGSAIFGQP